MPSSKQAVKSKPKSTSTRRSKPQPKPKRLGSHYLGLDQSSSYTGVAWLDIPNLTVYTTTLLAGSSSTQLIKRLIVLENFILSCAKANPTTVFTEQVYPGRRSVYGTLLRAEMTVHITLYKQSIPYEVIGAKEWSQHLNLKGTKEYAKEYFNDRLKNGTEHEYDALGVLFGGLIKSKLITLEWIKNPKLKFKRISQPNEFLKTVIE